MNSKASRKKTNTIIKAIRLPRVFLAFKIHKRTGNLPGSYRNLKKLRPIFGSFPSYHSQLAHLAYRQKLWNESLHHINIATQMSDLKGAIQYKKQKSNILIKLNENSKAITCLESYLFYESNDVNALYQIATLYINQHEWQKGADILESYIKIEPEDTVAYYKLGECYFNLNRLDQAEINYRQAISNNAINSAKVPIATLYYKLGLMQLKNNKSKQSIKSFNKVMRYDQELNSQKFGIGVYHEYFKQWEFAISSYKAKLSENDMDAELHFKLAMVLDKLKKTEQALIYYKKSLNIDKVHSKRHYKLANCYEQLEDYKNAAKWYKSAIARQQSHSASNYRRLGFVLNRIGESAQSLESYMEADLFQKSNVVEKGVHDKHINKLEVRYAISYEHYSINNKMIFYESLGGGRMMGNPYAIFKFVLNDYNFKDFIHVWVVSSFNVIPDELKGVNNLLFVKRKSDSYFKYISSAKYLICNSTFESFIVRKPEQYYLQTSHGIFYKTVGRDSSGSPVGVAGSTRNLLQATHIIVPNEFMADKQPKSYSIKNINSGRIAKIGYPRIDITLNASDELKREISSKLNLKPTKKSVFYAPTWRGSNKESNRFDSTKLIKDLNMLARIDANIIFRGHTITNKLLKDVQFPDNIILPTADIQTNEILSVTDVLISDYSSVFFDFIPTEKPIIHYLYDVEEYTKERGLNLTEQELPGTIAKSIKQLVESVENSLENNKPSSHYLEVKNRFCFYDNGNSTERTVRWFFYKDDKNIQFVDKSKNNKSLLYLGGTLENKTKLPELITELNKLMQHDYTVSIMLKKKVAQDKDKINLIGKLNSNINLLAHAGKMPVTTEEISAITYYKKNGRFANSRMKNAYNKAFKREARRLFGDSKFDCVSNYETESHYWNALMDNVY